MKFKNKVKIKKKKNPNQEKKKKKVTNLPEVRETWVLSLGWEDPLEEAMATHFSIIAWRIPRDRGAWWR